MYKLTNNTSIIRTTDGACIPSDTANSDYTEYLEWAKTNAAQPADPAPVPTYQELRAAEYPPMSDYLDGLVNGDKAQMQAYIDACLAIKAKYPKP